MSKETLFYRIFEFILFFAPLAIALIKWGSWKKEVDLKINNLQKFDERQTVQYSTILSTMNDIQLSVMRIETKVEYMEKEKK